MQDLQKDRMQDLQEGRMQDIQVDRMQDVQVNRRKDIQDNDVDGKNCLFKEITNQITHIIFIYNDIEEFNNVNYNEDQDEESDDDEHDKQSVEALHYIAG